MNESDLVIVDGADFRVCYQRQAAALVTTLVPGRMDFPSCHELRAARVSAVRCSRIRCARCNASVALGLSTPPSCLLTFPVDSHP